MACCNIRIRYVIALASFFGFFLNHSIKNVTNVTLVGMTSDPLMKTSTNITELSSNNYISETSELPSTINSYNWSTIELRNWSPFPIDPHNLSTIDPHNLSTINFHNLSTITIKPSNLSTFNNLTIATISSTINWNHKTRNMVQSSFFYGYIILQLPSGRISELIGTRAIFGPAILIASILSFAFPYAASTGSSYACLVRFVQGLFLGVSFPSMHSLISQWSPINERSMLVSLIYSGSSMGLVVVEMASGFFSSSNFLGGWPAMYLLIGCAGIAWFIFWIFFVYDKPEMHCMITQSELMTINKGRNKVADQEHHPLPICSILKTVPVHALIVASVSHSWNIYFVSFSQPEYMDGVLEMDIRSNGFASSLPHLAYTISSCIFAFICDKLRKSGTFSVTGLRKFFNSVGCFGPAICFILIPYFGVNSFAVNILFIISMVLAGSVISGVSVNHVDMSPTFAGSLMGLTNFFGNFTGFLVPLATTYLVGESKQIIDWAQLFYLSSCLSLFGGIIFLLFGSSSLQSWEPESRANNLVDKIKQASTSKA